MNLTWRRIKNYFRTGIETVKKDLKNDIPNTKLAFKEMLSNFITTDAKSLSWRFFTSNILRLFAVIFMLIDHFGFILFPQLTILRIIGRGAFPIFAFLVIIGSHFTRNHFKYAMKFLFLAFITQIFFFIIYFSIGQTIRIWPLYYIYFQLFFGAFTIYLFEKDYLLGWISFAVIGLIIFLISALRLNGFSSVLELDYGIYGYLLIVTGYLIKNIIFNLRYACEEKWLMFKMAFGFLLLALTGVFVLTKMQSRIQLYVFIALPLIVFYSNRQIIRIRYLKWIFLATYPLSFVIPGAISIWN